jgi:hypothetical protein
MVVRTFSAETRRCSDLRDTIRLQLSLLARAPLGDRAFCIDPLLTCPSERQTFRTISPRRGKDHSHSIVLIEHNPVRVSTRPPASTIRIFLKSVEMESWE